MTNFVVDTSVLVAIAKSEEEAGVFEHILTGTKWLIGWPTFLELRIWFLRNPNVSWQDWITLLLGAPEIEFIDFNRDLESIAAEAYARFGKGRHPAALNYGDCMTYAVARHLDVPLLFKGADFGKTDLKLHPASAIVA